MLPPTEYWPCSRTVCLLVFVFGLGLDRTKGPPHPHHFAISACPGITPVKLPCSLRLAWTTAAIRSTLETRPAAQRHKLCERCSIARQTMDGTVLLVVASCQRSRCCSSTLRTSVFENARLQVRVCASLYLKHARNVGPNAADSSLPFLLHFASNTPASLVYVCNHRYLPTKYFLLFLLEGESPFHPGSPIQKSSPRIQSRTFNRRHRASGTARFAVEK